MLAIRSDGILFAWGRRDNGQLGNNIMTTVGSQTTPIQIGSDKWIHVATGLGSSFAIREDKKLFAWGNASSDWGGGSSWLGDGNQGDYLLTPTQIGVSDWSFVCNNGADGTFAIRDDGTLFAWGRNTDNSGKPLGDGTTESRTTPVQISGDKFVSVAAGGTVAYAIRDDGKLFGWGLRSRLGIGSVSPFQSQNQLTPMQLGEDSWAAVATGSEHTLAIRDDGLLFAWGGNTAGKLGDGTTTAKLVPTQIGSSRWLSVSASTHSLAIRDDGKLFAWGENRTGELGDGGSVDKLVPTQVGTLNWLAAEAGGNFYHDSNSSGVSYGILGKQ